MKEIFQMAESKEKPVYRIVSPLGCSTTRSIPFASPLNALHGKKIGFVWSIFTHGNSLAEIIIQLMDEQFDDISFVKLPSGKTGKWGEYPHEDFPDVVRDADVDAVISLVGG